VTIKGGNKWAFFCIAGNPLCRVVDPTMSPRFTSCFSTLAAVTLAVLHFVGHTARGQVLFDNTKAETAGNADWIIDIHQPIPSPSISGITGASAETYWTGALSSWGVALAKLLNSGQISLPGNGLETLPIGGSITYGNSSNPQDLSRYQVFVVCEPNIQFTDAEKVAILTFVANGGGLFMVADHNGSDRNNDGWDSVRIWNDLMYTNSVQTNPFGFSVNMDDATPAANVDSSPSDPLTQGLGGPVATLQYSSGATMTINTSARAHAAVWAASATTNVMALYGTYGAGRFVAIGDSSVVEDATSSSGQGTFPGWTTPPHNGYCAINGTVWLLGGGTTNPLPPSVTTAAASGVGVVSAALTGLVNPNGLPTMAEFQYGIDTNYGSAVLVAGTLTGTTAQAVSATVGGLSAGTTYHFRVTATNAIGSADGLDQTFATTGISAGATNVVMSQFYGAGGNSSGVTYRNDFVELFNPGTSTVNLGSWSVQYASASGTSWLVASLTGSVAPYHYYLVQLASGGANGAALPTADASGTINISATSGKLALVNSQTALTGSNPSGSSQVVDFVGYGAANAFVGTGTATSGGNTTSTLRKLGGYANTTNNAADFMTSMPPVPRNSASPTNPPPSLLSPDLASVVTHSGDFTQADNGRTYTIVVTNLGAGATVGTVSVSDILPLGLTAVGISGTGWATNLATLTSTRSDGLAAGASYPPITVTVNVAANAPADVTNAVIVSGGGETNTANNTAWDPTTIISLTPIQAWRLRWFGTTVNGGLAADGYVASSDGMANLLKYALGLDPLTPSDNPVVWDILTGHLRLTSPRNPAATDVTFHAEVAGVVSGVWATNGTTVDVETGTELQVHDDAPVNSSTGGYMRLRVSRP
jgi:uncharacterized repeat protein (TIGR01451 family)